MLQHNEDLKKYLQKQLDECTLETTKVEKRLFQFVCSVAHKNTEIYAQYQACIEEQLNEIRKLSDVCNSKENHGEQPQDDATLDLTNHSGSCSFGNSTENDAWFHNLSFSKLQDSFLSFTAVDCE